MRIMKIVLSVALVGVVGVFTLGPIATTSTGCNPKVAADVTAIVNTTDCVLTQYSAAIQAGSSEAEAIAVAAAKCMLSIEQTGQVIASYKAAKVREAARIVDAGGQ